MRRISVPQHAPSPLCKKQTAQNTARKRHQTTQVSSYSALSGITARPIATPLRSDEAWWFSTFSIVDSCFNSLACCWQLVCVWLAKTRTQTHTSTQTLLGARTSAARINSLKDMDNTSSDEDATALTSTTSSTWSTVDAADDTSVMPSPSTPP